MGQFMNSRLDIKGHGNDTAAASQNTSVGYLVEYCDEALLNKSRPTDINLKEYGIPENGLLSLEGRICQNYDVVAHDEWNFYYFQIEGFEYVAIFDQDFVEQDVVSIK
jgi:hypothetical protein